MVVRVIAPAKVNLFLGVGPVRSDGYHDVTTVLHTLELHDTLTLSPAEKPSLTCSAELGVPAEDNLAYRALVALADVLGREPHVAIALNKRIPHGAGLGGGSSDAAAVIAGAARMWDVDPLDERCVEVAASLGADVPFFLQPSGCALMVGRGDRFERVLPAMPGVPAVIVKPPAPVPTARAYRAFDEHPMPAGRPDAVVSALEAADAGALAAALANNLESAAGDVVPEVAEALAWVSGSAGVTGAVVAGSGSAVLGVCADDEFAKRLADAAQQQGWLGIPTALAGAGVSVTEG